MVNGAVYTATITGSTYSCVMKPGEYNTSVVTTNGGETYDRVSIVSGGNNVNEVYVEVPASTGSITYAPDDIAKLTCTGTVASRGNDFTAKSGATVTIPVTGESVVTINAYYNSAFKINGGDVNLVNSGSTTQIDTFTVNASSDVVLEFVDGTKTDGSAFTISYITSISVNPVVAFKSEINVPGDYDTLTDAVAAIKGMDGRPEGEEGRITINLTADIQEQVVIDTPYIKINGNGHTISWYYGVGTFYYSVDSTGLYSERLFRDKYSSNEGNGSLWGGVVIVKGDYFIAENTTFKNTYNYEVTDKEIEDFAKTATSTFPQKFC